MNKKEFQRRTKRFGLDVIALIRTLPPDVASVHVGRQLVRSGTGVGANYRHACRAKSNANFISRRLALIHNRQSAIIRNPEIRNQSAIRNPRSAIPGRVTIAIT